MKGTHEIVAGTWRMEHKAEINDEQPMGSRLGVKGGRRAQQLRCGRGRKAAATDGEKRSCDVRTRDCELHL